MIDVWNRVMTNLRIAERGVCSKIASTTSDISATFPALAVEQIENYDTAVDMELTETAVMSIIRIQAYSKKNLAEARKVMDTACDAMRRMGFRRYFGPRPIPNTVDGMVYRLEARFRRVVSDIDEDVPKFSE